MKANPDKCQAPAIGKKSMDTNIVFDLAGNKIKCENEAKLLGVIIYFELKFNSHISNICKKASRQLNVLKRTPSNFASFSHLILFPAKSKTIFVSIDFLPIAGA
jgi:hypothetical protein